MRATRSTTQKLTALALACSAALLVAGNAVLPDATGLQRAVLLVILLAAAGLALVIAFAAGLVAGALWRSTWIARLLSERGRLRHALRLAESRRPAATPPHGGG